MTDSQMYYQSRQNTFIPMLIEEKIAKRIKELRLEKKLTQEELAWKSELDRTYMNHVENAKRNISIQVLEKIIVHGLEMNFNEFFNAKIFQKK